MEKTTEKEIDEIIENLTSISKAIYLVAEITNDSKMLQHSKLINKAIKSLELTKKIK